MLDTNVIISAFISPGGKPSQILKMILGRYTMPSAMHNSHLILHHNSAILSEYENVMKRPKFSDKISFDNVRRFVDLLRKIGIPFDPIPSSVKLIDESDRIFYDTAKGSNSFLISGNIKHYPKEPFILTPEAFIRLVRQLC